MRQHRIVLLPGDGIGPEITSVAKALLEAVSKKEGFELILEEHAFGGNALDYTLGECLELDYEPVVVDIALEMTSETCIDILVSNKCSKNHYFSFF